jgi:hypothetical protein
MADPEPTPAPSPEVDVTTLHARLLAVENRVTSVEAEVGPGPFASGRVPGAMDFVSQYRGSPGFLLDEARARETPCLCYELESQRGRELCYSKGIIGALDPEQEALYCPTKEELQLTPAQRARIEAFQAGADTCKAAVQDLPEGTRLEPYMACLHTELKERGQQL